MPRGSAFRNTWQALQEYFLSFTLHSAHTPIKSPPLPGLRIGPIQKVSVLGSRVDWTLAHKERTEWTAGHLPTLAGGQKNAFWGNDFELWPNICLQRNMISTIRKKRVNLQGLPYMPPNVVNFGPQTAENGWWVFAHPLLVALGDTASLTAWTLYNRQQANFGTCYVVARAYSLEQQNAGRAHAGLCHASGIMWCCCWFEDLNVSAGTHIVAPCDSFCATTTTVLVYVTHSDSSRMGRVFSGCLFVCLFFHTISQNRSSNVT